MLLSKLYSIMSKNLIQVANALLCISAIENGGKQTTECFCASAANLPRNKQFLMYNEQ